MGQTLFDMMDACGLDAALKPLNPLVRGNGFPSALSRPDPAQSQLAAQLNGLAFGATLLSILTATKKLPSFPKSTFFSPLIAIGAVGGALLTNLFNIIRAWDSRHEKDGRMILFRTPLPDITRGFILNNRHPYLPGLCGVMENIQNEGKRITAKKYCALVQSIQMFLRSLACKERINNDSQWVFCMHRTVLTYVPAIANTCYYILVKFLLLYEY